MEKSDFENATEKFQLSSYHHNTLPRAAFGCTVYLDCNVVGFIHKKYLLNLVLLQ